MLEISVSDRYLEDKDRKEER